MGKRTICRAGLLKPVNGILSLCATTPLVMTLGVLRVDGSYDGTCRRRFTGITI